MTAVEDVPRKSKRTEIVTTQKRIRTEAKSTLQQPSKRKRSNDKVEEDDEILDVNLRSTRSRACNMRTILNRIDELEGRSVLVDDESNKCIICGENKRNIVLLPCQHLYLCQSCWYILKVKHIGSLPKSVFEDDNQNPDDIEMRPKCPVCRNGVKEEIPIRG